MTYFRHATSDDITLQLRLFNPATQLGVTGASSTVQIRRIRASQGGAALDGFFWNGTTFQAAPIQLAMTEVDSTNDAGAYEFLFAQTLIGLNQIYRVRFEQLTGVAAGFIYEQHIVTNEISVPATVAEPVIPSSFTVMGQLFTLNDALIASNLLATAGSTPTEVRTNATQSDDFFVGMIIGIANTAGTAARVIRGYANTNGAFTVDALPFTPSVNDRVSILTFDQSQLGAGSGSRQVTINVDAGGPAPDVSVSIFAADNVTFITKGITDSNGDVVFALDDNSYNARLSKAGFTFTVPEPFTVVADATFNFTGTGFTIPAPSAPNLCVIFGTNLTDAGGKDLVGACVQAFATTPQVVGGRQLGEPIAETTTDQNGNFTLELIRLAEVRFTIEDAGLDFIKTVPDLASQDVTIWP